MNLNFYSKKSPWIGSQRQQTIASQPETDSDDSVFSLPSSISAVSKT